MERIRIRWPEHPLVRGLPTLDGAAYRRLLRDIGRHGQREPIRLADGMIIDGRARLRACQDLGIEAEMQMERNAARWLVRQRKSAGKPLEAAAIERRAAALAQQTRQAWIRRARAAFAPGEPEPCAICGKYQEVAHAHHITPLHTQADRGAKTPDQAFVWLCPTHHAAVHALLDRQDWPALSGFTARERKLLEACARGAHA